MTFYVFVVALTAAALVCVFLVRQSGIGWGPWICYQVARIHGLLFTRWSARNKSTIPEVGPAIIVANHTSPVDPVVLWLGHFAGFRGRQMRIIRYMMAREYFVLRNPVGWACRTMQSIPVQRSGQDMAPIREALNCLRRGDLLGLFPEGRINFQTPDEQLLPGGTGVAWLALKSGVPVLPVFIHNAPRGRTMVSSFFTRTRTTVTYGAAVDLADFLDEKLTREVLAEATDRIMQSVADLGNIRITPVMRASSADATVFTA